MNPTVWTYWEGKSSPIIELCLETLKRHNKTLEVLTPETVKLPPAYAELVKGIPIPQRSDLIRLYYIYKFGGMWVDADCIAIRPLDLHLQVPNADLVGVWNKYMTKGFGMRGMLAVPFGARRNSPIILEALEKCRDLISVIKSGEKVPYGATSVDLLSKMYHKYHHQTEPVCERLEHWRYNRVPWYSAKRVFTNERPDHIHSQCQYWGPRVILYHLCNTVISHYHTTPRKELLRGKSFVSFLFRKALST